MQAVLTMHSLLLTVLLTTTPPNSASFRGWSVLSAYQTNNTPLEQFNQIEINCYSDKLYPTHPSMIAKDYHVFLTGGYDHFKLTAQDEACKISAPKWSKKNAQGQLGCLAAYKVHYALISDTFTDKCGNLYRGFEEQIFFPEKNRMQDLWSVGRCTFPDPNSELNDGSSKIFDMIAGHTYEVSRSQFRFLTPLFEGDLKKIEEARALAQKTHVFDPTTLLYK